MSELEMASKKFLERLDTLDFSDPEVVKAQIKVLVQLIMGNTRSLEIFKENAKNNVLMFEEIESAIEELREEIERIG